MTIKQASVPLFCIEASENESEAKDIELNAAFAIITHIDAVSVKYDKVCP